MSAAPSAGRAIKEIVQCESSVCKLAHQWVPAKDLRGSPCQCCCSECWGALANGSSNVCKRAALRTAAGKVACCGTAAHAGLTRPRGTRGTAGILHTSTGKQDSQGR